MPYIRIDYPNYFGLFLYVLGRTKQIQWPNVSQTPKIDRDNKEVRILYRYLWQISTSIVQKMYFKSRLKEEGCSDSSIEDETTNHKERQHPALWRISILNHLMIIKNTNRASRSSTSNPINRNLSWTSHTSTSKHTAQAARHFPKIIWANDEVLN